MTVPAEGEGVSMSEQPVQAGEPVTIQPADQPPIQQPAQPAQAGDQNYVEQGDGSMAEQDAPADEGTAADNGTSNESAEPQPGVVPGTVYPSAAGQPPGSVVADPPPAGGPGEQSLAEQQAGGKQAAAGVPVPEAGPGGSSPYAAPAAAYPAEATADDGGRSGNVPAGNATSNESPRLPGNLTSGAARAHAALSQADDVQGNGELSESDRLSKLSEIISFAMHELDRFLPTHVRQPAADEVSREL